VKVTPRTPSGFLELLPAEQIVFNQMIKKIQHTYELFGFTPIETPAIEYSEILLAKAGGETEKQIYRFTKGSNDLCLHFDLTVPLARYVAEHANQITFPFRRYQIQKVWRAERPQRGRFREFYQCDIDVIGSFNPLIDAEIPSVIFTVFKNLGFEKFTIKVNNRKVLNGFLAGIGAEEQSQDILRLIDKVEKISRDDLIKEAESQGISKTVMTRVFELIDVKGTNEEVLKKLKELPVNNDKYTAGIKELELVLSGMSKFKIPPEAYKVDLTIARGLDYYTGTVYETTLDDYPSIGSVCSGGRYDDLASHYTNATLPGVGVSIGLTRLFDQLRLAGALNITSSIPTKVLVVPISEEFLGAAMETATEFRHHEVSAEVYLEEGRFGKKLDYANKQGVPFVAIVGTEEVQENELVLKNMADSSQVVVTIDQASEIVKK